MSTPCGPAVSRSHRFPVRAEIDVDAIDITSDVGSDVLIAEVLEDQAPLAFVGAPQPPPLPVTTRTRSPAASGRLQARPREFSCRPRMTSKELSFPVGHQQRPWPVHRAADGGQQKSPRRIQDAELADSPEPTTATARTAARRDIEGVALHGQGKRMLDDLRRVVVGIPVRGGDQRALAIDIDPRAPATILWRGLHPIRTVRPRAPM